MSGTGSVKGTRGAVGNEYYRSDVDEATEAAGAKALDTSKAPDASGDAMRLGFDFYDRLSDSSERLNGELGGRGARRSADELCTKPSSGGTLTIADLRAGRGFERPASRPSHPRFDAFVAKLVDPARVSVSDLEDPRSARLDIRDAFDGRSARQIGAELGSMFDDVSSMKSTLRKELRSRGDLSRSQVEEAVEVVVAELENHYVSAVSQRIMERVEVMCGDSRDVIRHVNLNDTSRRQFLANLAAEAGGDLAKMTDGLRQVGVSEGTAETIAGLLRDHASSDEGRASLARGDDGPTVGYVDREGAFDYASRLVEGDLDEVDAELVSLTRTAQSGTFENRTILYDDMFSVARRDVLDELGVYDSDARKDVLVRHADVGARDEAIEGYLILGIGSLTGAAAGAVVAPAAVVGGVASVTAGAVSGTAYNAVGVAGAQDDLELTRSARLGGVATDADVAGAKKARDVAGATAAAQLVTGGLTGAADVSTAAGLAADVIVGVTVPEDLD